MYLPVDTAHRLKPGSPYGLAKLTVERYLEMAKSLYDVDYCILRYSNVYGPRQTHLEKAVLSLFSLISLKDEAPLSLEMGNKQETSSMWVI
ncbi:UDP-glucose 4-epimerase [Bacillus safensis FO-36b] [Bacillus safensis subsp. safensis]